MYFRDQGAKTRRGSWLSVAQSAVAFIVLAYSLPVAGAPQGYVKVWEDTFDGSSLNMANWTIGLRDPGTGHMVPGAIGQYLLNTSYAGYITSEDVWVSNSSLYLQNQRRTFQGTSPAGTYNYTTGWIMSMHKVHFNKGYLEMRAQFPSGDKVWPAFWLIAEDLVWGPEWDMYEYFGYRSDVGYDNMGLHLCYGSYPQTHWLSNWLRNYNAVYGCQAWHIYGFEWTADYTKWTIDGVEVLNLNNTIGSSWPNEEMYIVLNNGVRTESPDTNTTWPNQVVIDYIELYQPEQTGNWTKIDDRDPMVSYDASWGQWNGNPGYMNTETFCETAGGEATFSFVGTKARYYGFKRNDLGYADLFIDGVYQTSIDCYASISPQYNVMIYETPELAGGTHTLSVQVAGIKNPASSGTEVIVDAFSYVNDAPAVDAYINGIAMAFRKSGKNNYYGQATVSVKDETGANVPGATVYGNWSGAVSAPGSGITGANGAVMIESPGKRNGGTFTFTVTDVVKSGFTYNPALNVVTSASITAP